MINFEIKTQLSVNVENTPGAIATLSDKLAEHDISLNAITVNEGHSSGSFRFVANDHETARTALVEAGYSVQTDDVLSIRLQDSKGKLAFLTKAFSQSGINIDYMYASVDEEGGGSKLILKVSNIHLASQVLTAILDAA
ncbi:ACT domain-containing protein [Pelagicoccus albus]|uniref:ACT domain-containing protein n=1 Tax=Pelagicoccus albus TaxID=415222 RepID=A0A7X1E890_9BACT|nr:ACT domain-containing protein [Pelagicoccus albus]MBC2606560.1 ACT domain-containing protein [Pelagicoccus albus]